MPNARVLGNTAWRDWSIDGVPSSGANDPDKAEIRAFVDALVRAEVKTEDFDVLVGDRLSVDTSDAAVMGTMPPAADLEDGDEFTFNDFAGTWGTNAFTLNGNDTPFGNGNGGTIDNLICNVTKRFSVTFAGGVFVVRTI
ncbi:hypothetical protein [Reyranella sp.]|uniref:hypothetical protein n=1 Tax=Reyranella sp. TaxID=1929291 RepID=UPI003F6EFF29